MTQQTRARFAGVYAIFAFLECTPDLLQRSPFSLNPSNCI